MQAIHRIAKVIDNQVIIKLPSDFVATEVEVTLKPLKQRKDDVCDLEKEIDIGIKSPVSPRSHNEIFDNLRKKYESG